MPRSIDVLTSSSAPAWPTALMPLTSPLPSPNVMVPKQSFDTRRPVLPSVAYSMAYSFLVKPKSHWREGVGRWHGRLPFGVGKNCGFGWRRPAAHAALSTPRGIARRTPVGGRLLCIRSRHDRSSSIDRSLLPVAHQHVAACGRKLWTIFLEASQNGKIALIHQLAAETLHVVGACLLLLIRAAMGKGASRNRDRQQDERQKEFVHGVTTFSLGRAPASLEGRNAVHSITIAWSFSADAGACLSSRTSGMAASERIIINLKSSM